MITRTQSTHFKTLKYRLQFPERFGCIQDVKQYCQTFFTWYNTMHKHSGIAMLTPQSVHYGKTEIVLEKRQQTLEQAFDQHPERFKHRSPKVKQPPQAAYINKPKLNQPEESKITH